jgi:hypothetical protein
MEHQQTIWARFFPILRTLAITWPQIVLPSDNDDLGGGSGAWHC